MSTDKTLVPVLALQHTLFQEQ